jgi:serine/threonine-protein kinase
MKDDLLEITPLAKGGQKEVFSALHPVHGEVVLKLITPTTDSLERVKREIRAVSLMSSPFIPRILAHNCDEQNPDKIWLIEERISGQSLRDILKAGRIFTIGEIVHFLDTMLTIAEDSEKNSLVHRDIKPENIMLDTDGNFWLFAFAN